MSGMNTADGVAATATAVTRCGGVKAIPARSRSMPCSPWAKKNAPSAMLAIATGTSSFLLNPATLSK